MEKQNTKKLSNRAERRTYIDNRERERGGEIISQGQKAKTHTAFTVLKSCQRANLKRDVEGKVNSTVKFKYH